MDYYVNNLKSLHFQKPVTKSSFQEVENIFKLYDITDVEVNLNYESENLIWEILKDKKKVQKITIYNLSLTDEEFDQFLKILDKNSSITEIILKFDITIEQMKAFSQFLAHNMSIKTLTFILNSKSSLNTLIDGLILNKSITNLSLGNPILPFTQDLLQKLLKNNQTINHLKVQYLKGELEELGKVLINNTTLESLKFLDTSECSSLNRFLSSINQNKSLKSLFIKNKNYSNEKSFCELLKYNSSMKELYLVVGVFKDGRMISESLKNNQNLVKLDLSGNTFNNEAFRSIFRALNETSIQSLIMKGVLSQFLNGKFFDPLKDNTKLTVLILDNNNLGKMGLMNLIENLKHHKYLKELEIESIGTSYDDHYCLKDLISGCETLEKLSIRRNAISPKEIISLIETLKETDRLKHLDLSDLIMENEPCEVLGEYFSQSNRLEYINLAFNKISRSEKFKSLVKGIEINQSIKSINLENNDFSSDEFVDIMNALFYNLTLTQLDINIKYNTNIKELLFFKDMYLIRNSKMVKTSFIRLEYDVQFKFINSSNHLN